VKQRVQAVTNRSQDGAGADNALDHKREIFAASVQGNTAFFGPRMLTLVYDVGGTPQQACGTLIAIKDALFVATAGHVIDDNPTGTYWLLTQRVSAMSDGFVRVAASGRHPRVDVGYLELSWDLRDTHLKGCTVCELSNIAVRQWGREACSVIVVGPPTEHTSITRDTNTVATYKASVMTYWSVPIPPSEWSDLRVPNSSSFVPFDPNVDVVLHYCEDDVITVADSGPQALPRPQGMSGGGIWDQDFSKGMVWSASSAKLIGIQSSWFERGRYLRGVQIIHWLNAIYADYPRLRKVIHQAFGKQGASKP